MTPEPGRPAPRDGPSRTLAATPHPPQGQGGPAGEDGAAAGGNAFQRARSIYREIGALLREALRSNPDSILAAARPLRLDLSVLLKPFGGDPDGEAEIAFASGLLERIRRLVDDEVSRHAPFPQGRIRCSWCGSFECPHAVPEGPRTVFTGYGPTGLPIWKEMAAFALERRDPRIDDFYREPPIPLAIVQPGRDLVSARLPVYGKNSGAYRILGQVAVGYLALRTGSGGERQPVALTLQAVEVDRGRKAVHLNVIGRLPDGTDLWRVLEEEPDSRLGDALRSLRARLAEVGLRAIRRGESRERQVMSSLWRLARNLERIFRQTTRRTKHSQDRHLDRERPAAAALRDAISARSDEIYRDVSESTWVVIGPRSRVHIFNDAGQHITSVVYPGETVRRRTSQGKWRTAPPESVRGFREALKKSTVDS